MLRRDTGPSQLSDHGGKAGQVAAAWQRGGMHASYGSRKSSRSEVSGGKGKMAAAGMEGREGAGWWQGQHVCSSLHCHGHATSLPPPCLKLEKVVEKVGGGGREEVRGMVGREGREGMLQCRCVMVHGMASYHH